jgi:wyosine [tRNA(Phe)-imidazoG37] synthetase (radical SAM superfamily)
VTNSKLRERDKLVIETAQYVDRPKFPRNVLIELANYCNHWCLMCAYKKSTRKRRQIDQRFFEVIIREAYSLGAREIGLYSGAEPLMCTNLERHIREAVRVGYEYVYLTTNGITREKRIQNIIDSGINSLKFSINGGDRETYRLVHGRDHFEIAINNLKFAAAYRESLGLKFYLSASFVQLKENSASLAEWKKLIEPLVDEIYIVQATNQSGQVPDLPASKNPYNICPYPFNQLHISAEGYLRLCCCDYQNFLAVCDLNEKSLLEAWESDLAVSARRALMNERPEGLLCHDCLTGLTSDIKPLNPDLAEPTRI